MATKATTIQLPQLDLRKFSIRLEGDAPLICHAWSTKAMQMMLSKQMKEANTGREAKSPEDDFQDSLYHLPEGGYGFPAVAFKSAAVDACSSVAGITKVQARGAFHILGDMVKIKGSPTPRQDMVRVGMGTADIRFRGEFREWSVDLLIQYNAGVLSPEQIVNLFNVGGFAVGVGEWRPQRDGSFGRFHVGGN
jgi:hypothetical protein